MNQGRNIKVIPPTDFIPAMPSEAVDDRLPVVSAPHPNPLPRAGERISAASLPFPLPLAGGAGGRRTGVDARNKFGVTRGSRGRRRGTPFRAVQSHAASPAAPGPAMRPETKHSAMLPPDM